MSILVLILQLDAKPLNKNIQYLQQLFSDPYFVIEVFNTDLPDKVPKGNSLNLDYYQNNHLVMKALEYAKEKHNEKPCLLIRDDTTTVLPVTGTIMKDKISKILSDVKDVDLIFLHKRNDRCDKFIQVKGQDNSVKWSFQPTSTQAIIYNTSARDYICKSLIKTNTSLSDMLNFFTSQKILKAVVFLPNLVNFDVDMAISNNDYNKMNECFPISNLVVEKPNVISIIWFIVILAVICVAAFTLIKMDKN